MNEDVWNMLTWQGSMVCIGAERRSGQMGEQREIRREEGVSQELEQRQETGKMPDQEQQEAWSQGDAVDQVLMERIKMITSQNRLSDMSGKFSRQDYIQAAVITVVCLCAVVAGAFL